MFSSTVSSINPSVSSTCAFFSSRMRASLRASKS
uniref:Uncharacterized protein n=1 Tax=Lepeophtheirus salmonis TaxID=72036 RepID=A0A0K2TVL6_LEPSM